MELAAMELAAFVVSIVSLGLMIGLHYRTTKFERSVANRNKHTLNFMANLIINAAYDPEIVRKLVADYQKEDRWRGVVCYRGDKHHSIAYKIPEPDEIIVGDLKIAVVSQPVRDDNVLS